MNNLTAVQKALKSNPNVVVFGPKLEDHEIVRNYGLPKRRLAFAGKVDYSIAPKVGLYSVEELNTFIDGLMPHIEPESRRTFYLHSSMLDFAILRFYDIFGKEIITRRMELAKRLNSEARGIVEGRKTMRGKGTYELQRFVRVKVYPDEAIAHDVFSENFKNGLTSADISLDLLEKYKTGAINT